jgi:antitoxin component YwqK of YwqJK toxin-antitoxin module
MLYRALILISFFIPLIGSAADIKCPKGTELAKRSEKNYRISYCGVESVKCFTQTEKERVLFSKGGRKACAVLEGPTHYHYNNKSLLIMHYRDGKLSGKSESFAPNDKKILEEYYKAGKIHGEKKEWHAENGQMKLKEKYVNGVHQGESLEWYPNGKMKRKAIYKDGKLEGPWTEWYENGKKARGITFNGGRWSGEFREWYSDGKPFSIGEYKDGKLVKAVQYFERSGKEMNAAAPRELASLPDGVEPSWIGDFDGNGFGDAVVPVPEKKSTKIYFTGPQGVVKSETIEELGLELYGARAERGQFAEPPSARDGLGVWEKEGGVTSIYLYDFDKELFNRSDHASDGH